MFAIYSLLRFWQHHPALFYGFAFLIGIAWALADSLWIPLLPILFLFLPFIASIFINGRETKIIQPLLLALLISFAGWGHINAHHSFPLLPEGGIEGEALIKIKNLRQQSNPFGTKWVYRCEIIHFISDNASISSLPCIIALPVLDGADLPRPRPLADRNYWVKGKLMQTNNGTYSLKVSVKTPWKEIPNTWSLAEERYQWKLAVSQWIEAKFSHHLSAHFLAGLATGEFDDHWMRHQFSRFGIQHLLAISGFHFAIIASCLSFALRLFFSTRVCALCLLICLGAYCFFLGPQPSILRAWLMSTLALVGFFLEKQGTALNSLGIALLAVLGYDPLFCQELGFQLSFVTTAAILLFYSPALTLFSNLLPKRNLSEVLNMNKWNQHGYCILSFLRQGLALTFAVNVVALPLTLYYFQQFPWISLLYNLFFPLMASLSLCLLLLGGALFFIPFLGNAIHQFNDAYTFFLLQAAYSVPQSIDHFFTMEVLSSFWLICYLTTLALCGILWRANVLEPVFSIDDTP